MSDTTLWKHLRQLLISLYISQSSQSPTELLEAQCTLTNAVDDIITSNGSLASMSVRAIALPGWKMLDPTTGLKHINDLLYMAEKTGITGHFVLSDLLRWKGELLLFQVPTSPEEQQKNCLIAKDMLMEAYSLSAQYDEYLPMLNSLTLLTKMSLVARDFHGYLQFCEELKVLFKKIELLNPNFTITVVEEAKNLIGKESLL